MSPASSCAHHWRACSGVCVERASREMGTTAIESAPAQFSPQPRTQKHHQTDSQDGDSSGQRKEFVAVCKVYPVSGQVIKKDAENRQTASSKEGRHTQGDGE